MTTIRQAIAKAQKQLRSEDARFDALCLAEKAFGLNKTQLRLYADRVIDTTSYDELVRRRASGEPLQYILGEWEFYGHSYSVGPGVLIPRPETELLIDIAREYVVNSSFSVIDLCAGSGCVGLSVAKLFPRARVYLVELSDEAMPYLRKNAAHVPNARIIQADIFNSQFSILNSRFSIHNSQFSIHNSQFTIFNAQCSMLNAQIILSNPPYVRSAELDALSAEVKHEPQMALDGGTDGLRFYRALAERWLPLLPPGGMLAAECGDGQADDVAALFSARSKRVEIREDQNKIPRVVIAAT
ncbi:MAG: peptide chain release factor N(5)-glutamine methyltransferase [Oscillospiraceae bacterium]|nr:peptide chain release factor N(5)-glutamine methyltransferase [Oscillospiraceae bacterium]